MDTVLLEYFIKVATHQNISRAAADLHISQPSLSVAIKKLEDELGAKLFLRVGKRLKITDYGQSFLVTAREVLMLLNDQTANAAAERKSFTILFRSPQQGVVEALEVFHKRHPEVYAAAFSGSYSSRDFPLSYYDFIVDEVSLDLPSTMDVLELPPRKYYAVLPSSHWLAREKELSLSQLSKEEFVFQRSNQYEYEGLYQLCINEGFVPKCTITASDMTFKMHFIASECGIGLVPDIWLDVYRNFDNLRLVPLKGEWQARTPKLLISESVRSNPSARQFLDELRIFLNQDKKL